MGMKKNPTEVKILPVRGRTPRSKKYLFRTKFNRLKCGVESAFIQLTEQVGIKLFPREYSAIECRKNQIKAARRGLGPKVLSEVFICHRADGRRITTSECRDNHEHGYLTQVASPRPSRCTEELFNKLEKRFNKIGMDCCDLHDDNVGFIGKKAVIIDFGSYSF
jgi:hypothetical protein